MAQQTFSQLTISRIFYHFLPVAYAAKSCLHHRTPPTVEPRTIEFPTSVDNSVGFCDLFLETNNHLVQHIETNRVVQKI